MSYALFYIMIDISFIRVYLLNRMSHQKIKKCVHECAQGVKGH